MLSTQLGKASQFDRRGLGWKIEIREKEGKGFQVQWKRWVVERTFAWLGNCRRLSKDYKKWPENHEGVVYVAMI